MKKTEKTFLCAFCLLVCAFCLPYSAFAQCLKPNNNSELAANNIKALFKTNGAHFFIEKAEFEVPKGSGISSLFAAGLWLGGKDEQDNLHLAAMRFGQLGNDYWGGPVSNGGAEAASYYDRFWSITKEEIEYHKANYNNPVYITPDIITNWPASGRPEYGESAKLAPYKSVSGNSTYTPSQGDYPLIRGDQALFWINNDNCGAHTETNGKPLGVEVMSMAYAYNKPEYELQHTIFISYEIRNKSENNYKDFYVGFFADFDIGDGSDDYIGCDSSLNLAYGYNGKEIDGNGGAWTYGNKPPAQGAMFLNQKMSAFTYFNNAGGPTGDPRTSIEYYNYLQGKWADGTPLTLWGNGYKESTEYTNFAFNGDPVAQTGWTEVTPNGSGSTPNTPGDRRGAISTGPFTLPAGGTICIDIALPFAQDLEGNNITSVAMLKQKVQAIQQFYDNQQYEMACGGNIGIKEKEINKAAIQVFPNPTKGQFTVKSESIIENIELYDMRGQKVYTNTPKKQSFQIDIDLSRGLYLYRAVLQDGSISSGKIVVQL